MASSAPPIYQPQMPSQPQPTQQLQYQPAQPYSHPYSPGNNYYANSLISTYGQLPPPGPPSQPYAYDQPAIGVKRASDDVLQAVDLFSKRPRPDSGGALAYYPQRPGEKLCAFYMTTRTCSFGYSCKFDHPIWVPHGGIPNWKEVTGSSANAAATVDHVNLPHRIGEPNCAYYMKTGDCKYGSRCKFNHPKERNTHVPDSALKDDSISDTQNEASGAIDGVPTSGNPTANTSIPSAAQTASSVEKGAGKTPPLNSKGLPLRQYEIECSYYMKTGGCKYGVACRFHHPEVIRAGPRSVLPIVPSQGMPGSIGPPIPYATEYGMKLASLPPQRPGETDCTYYLKTGSCSFGAACKYHHPLNRQPSNLKATPKLTMAGLPRREGEVACAYYMKTGTCKYGSTCKFDHPTPGEVAAKAAAEATRPEVSIEEVYDVNQSQGILVPYVTANSAQGATDAK